MCWLLENEFRFQSTSINSLILPIRDRKRFELITPSNSSNKQSTISDETFNWCTGCDCLMFFVWFCNSIYLNENKTKEFYIQFDQFLLWNVNYCQHHTTVNDQLIFFSHRKRKTINLKPICSIFIFIFHTFFYHYNCIIKNWEKEEKKRF